MRACSGGGCRRRRPAGSFPAGRLGGNSVDLVSRRRKEVRKEPSSTGSPSRPIQARVFPKVFKFGADGGQPSLVLGEEFEPGSDRTHFCKPTDVAVAWSGHVFVSDGYCNSRIVAFRPDGAFHGQFGQRERMAVPHSLSLREERRRLCVADRENARILCYRLRDDASVGDPVIDLDVPTGSVYAIADAGRKTLAVTQSYDGEPGATGIAVDLDRGGTIDVWNSRQGLSQPHDLAASPDGKLLYVADLDPGSPKVYKFYVD